MILNIIDLAISISCVIPTLMLLISRKKYDTGNFVDALVLLSGLGMWGLFGALSIWDVFNIYKKVLIDYDHTYHTLAIFFAGIVYIRFLMFMSNKTKYKAIWRNECHT